jgi:hypothetical protein
VLRLRACFFIREEGKESGGCWPGLQVGSLPLVQVRLVPFLFSFHVFPINIGTKGMGRCRVSISISVREIHEDLKLSLTIQHKTLVQQKHVS